MQVASPIDWAATLEALIGSGVDRVLDLEFASAQLVGLSCAAIRHGCLYRRLRRFGDLSRLSLTASVRSHRLP